MGVRSTNNIKTHLVRKPGARFNTREEVLPSDIDAIGYVTYPDDLEIFGTVPAEEAYLEATVDLSELGVNYYAMSNFDDGMSEGEELVEVERAMNEEVAEWQEALDNHGGIFRFNRDQMVYYLKEARQGGPLMKLRGDSEVLLDSLDEDQLAELLNEVIPNRIKFEWDDPRYKKDKKLKKFSVKKLNQKP